MACTIMWRKESCSIRMRRQERSSLAMVSNATLCVISWFEFASLIHLCHRLLWWSSCHYPWSETTFSYGNDSSRSPKEDGGPNQDPLHFNLPYRSRRLERRGNMTPNSLNLNPLWLNLCSCTNHNKISKEWSSASVSANSRTWSCWVRHVPSVVWSFNAVFSIFDIHFKGMWINLAALLRV